MARSRYKLMDELSRCCDLPFSVRFGLFCAEPDVSVSLFTSASKQTNKFANPTRIDFNQCVNQNESQNDESSDETSINKENTNKLTSKSFSCPYKSCSNVYTSSYGLKYHIDHGHTQAKNNEKRPFTCPVKRCGKKYKNTNGLKYHVMHAHKGYEYEDGECIY